MVYRKLKLNTSYLSILENLVIVYFFVDFFFKFKKGSLRSVHKYVRLLKYITISKILLIDISICLKEFLIPHLQEENTSYYAAINILSNEAYSFYNTNNNKLDFGTLILLYYLYNVFNLVSKFTNLFKLRNKRIKFRELFYKPYRLFFVKEFPKQIVESLNIKEDY